MSGIVFKEYEENFRLGIKELDKFINNYFDEDGFPLSRNPNDLIHFTKYMLLLSKSIKDAQQHVPDFLDEIIKKNLICIKLIKTPNDQIPFFNGGYENKLNKFRQLFGRT